MKKLLTTLLLVIATTCFSQDYIYNFKIKNVNNIESAKNTTDYIRFLFKNNPTFLDSIFIINSNIDISKDELELYLIKYNYNIEYFSKTARKQILKEEDK